MRIGIDAREICGRPTGVGRYLSGLLREWGASERARAHAFVLYAPEPVATMPDAERLTVRIVPGSAGTWWEQVHLPRAIASDRVDVFFAPAYTAPLRIAVPLVLTIHDLSYVAHPEWFRLREGVRRRLLTRASARRARTIVTVSEFSKREILDRLNVRADTVRVIPQGIDPVAATTADRSNPRVLYVGSIFNRRHVPDLIRALALLARDRPGVSLDIVGDDRTYPREDIEELIAQRDCSGCVQWHRYATDERLRELYGRARAFAFLSEYEGLGMTPLEALTAGIPPVVLDTPAAHETLGDAAVYVPLDPDIPAVARGLAAALFDEDVRARVLAAAPAVLERYSWTRAGAETLSVLEEVAAS